MPYQYSPVARAGAGAAAGMIAGMAMGLTAMIHGYALGLGFWLPMKLIAALYWGVMAIIGGPAAIVAGLLTHMVMSAALGMLFVAIGNRLGAGASLVVGALYAVGVWAVNTWLVLPWLNRVMLDRQMVAPGWWLAYHLIFGCMLFLVPLFVRWFGQRQVETSAALDASIGST
ncbi:MAG: hypothetical protein M3041_11885 [Acidobacteriota bacterium]|nr:hypothetical protein [Acidobacteriota bacterium]